MIDLDKKTVLVIGLGASGKAAAQVLRRHGSAVFAVDESRTPNLETLAEQLESEGIQVELGARKIPKRNFDFVVLSPGVPPTSVLVKAAVARKIEIIGELELGYQLSRCMNISITGTNGKTTTTELVARLLTFCDRKTMAAGNIGLPICALTEQSRELDFLTLEVSSFQLETIQFFRPSVAILMNLTPDHLDRYPSMTEYILAKAQIFKNQQPFDWAIVQSEALKILKARNIYLRGKVITFSADDSSADIILDRGLLVSKIEGWSGPLLDMKQCQVKGPHNAENIMAALAVGRVLRLSLDRCREAVKSYEPAKHRCEFLGEVNGVQYVNDSKATNVDAVVRALMTMPQEDSRKPNIILIAGGKDKGFDYHDAGPWISNRVKRAFLIGETAQKLRAAWGLFTPCAVVDSLLEAVTEAAKIASPGDVVLLSPACSSFDQFQNYQHRGEVFRNAVIALRLPTCGGAGEMNPKILKGESA
jgi:UDP-N-acetylmuramoylalanine--D-glutamate ligase